MSNINELNKTLNDICDSQLFNVKWYFKDLKTGESLDRKWR